jgi:ubiquinone/menaquinone biosynthesis C-methylase UbiE
VSEKWYLCGGCKERIPVRNGIPRFVDVENYAGSFGIQWNRFSKTQIDSALGTNRSERRFLEETLWSPDEISGRHVLDAGCGAGRFSEVALKYGAKLVAVDFSSAVEAANENLKHESRLIIQGDLSKLPIKNASFGYIYCIGVLQHTSDPKAVLFELLRCLQVGGEITLTFYENSSWHVRFYSKYIIRPFTKRLPRKILLKLISGTSRFWFPVTSFLFKLPSPLSRFFRFIIPIANYVEFDYTSKHHAVEEAILDTFDMLSPEFDRPIKKEEILNWIKDSGYNLIRLDSQQLKGNMRFKKSI